MWPSSRMGLAPSLFLLGAWIQEIPTSNGTAGNLLCFCGFLWRESSESPLRPAKVA
jgi:hypothetical protein